MVRAVAAPSGPCEIAARVPSWADGVTTTLNGRSVNGRLGTDGYLRWEREWSVGDELVLEFPMAPRLVRASDDIDSVRGCVAYERGPLVYCFEGGDVPGRGSLAGVSVVGRNTPVEAPGVDIRGHSVVGLKLEGVARADLTPAKWPYYDTAAGNDGSGGSAHSDRSDGDERDSSGVAGRALLRLG